MITEHHQEKDTLILLPQFDFEKIDKSQSEALYKMLAWPWDLPKSQCLEKHQTLIDKSIKNYIILLREIKVDLKHGETYIIDVLEDSILLTCQFSIDYPINLIQCQSKSPKASYRNWQIDYKIHM